MERSQEEVAAQASERMDKSEYKRFCEHRADLIRAHEEHQKEVVKIYLTTASVFFAVSMAFIKDIVRLDVASLKGLLIASWVFFILVIFSSSFSAFISSRTAAGQVDFYDKYIDKNKRMPDVEPITEEAEANKKKLAEHNAMIQNLNLGAAISFPLAFVFLILFIGLNILN